MEPSKRPLVDVRVVAEGLVFPEGPVALDDGSLLVAEIRRGVVTRIPPDGTGRPEVVAEPGGGPNGMAIGPDGALYVCNNGGAEAEYRGGRVERVDLDTGKVEVLYEACDGRRLAGPNDLVFDGDGGFWFTDTGKFLADARLYGGLFHARADGSGIVRVIDKVDAPNGIGLSPDGRTLYWAETLSGRLYGREIVGPGELVHDRNHDPDSLVGSVPGVQMFDSLAVAADGSVCVGTLISGVVTQFSADGGTVTQHTLPDDLFDPMVTNLCFGGPDRTTAYLTLSETGRVVACTWPTPGLALEHRR
ncbi:MAG TPA: SMP-30/gluconolactonase/LRE family protein [Acidimicrobiales bacterium]